MPDVIDPPKKSFTADFAASRPATESEFKAMQAGEYPKQNEPIQSDKKNVAAVPAAATQQPKPILDKPASTYDPDEEILSGKRTPKNDDFKRIKNAATEATKRADDLKAKHEAAEKKVVELEKRSGSREEVEKLKKERDELAGKWQAVAAQFDAGFHTKYETKVGDAIAKIKDAVPADKLDRLAWLIQQPDGNEKRKAMAELTEDMDPPTITEIMLANREVRDILAARKKELDDSGTILKTSAEQRRKEQEDRKAAYAQSFDSVLAKAQAKDGEAASPLYQIRDGDDAETKAWNASVSERSAVARKGHFDEFETAEDKAEFSMNAAAYPAALSVIKELQTENDSLKETMAKLQSASPGLGSGGKAQDGGRKMTFTERAVAEAI